MSGEGLLNPVQKWFNEKLNKLRCYSIHVNPVIWIARLPKIRCFRSLDHCLIAKEVKLYSESLHLGGARLRHLQVVVVTQDWWWVQSNNYMSYLQVNSKLSFTSHNTIAFMLFLLRPPTKWPCRDVTMCAPNFLLWERGKTHWWQFPTCDLKRKEGWGGNGASALGWKMDAQTYVCFALKQTSGFSPVLNNLILQFSSW